MNTNLQIGQRIDVWEVLPGNDFAQIQEDDMQIGSQRTSFDKAGYANNAFGGVWIDSKYGECYHFPVEGQLKKVGTLVIKTLK